MFSKFFLVGLLLKYKNAVDFCVLILCTATLLNLGINVNSGIFWLYFLGLLQRFPPLSFSDGLLQCQEPSEQCCRELAL